MKEFKSVKRMKESSEKDLIDLVGKSKAQIIQNAIKKGDL
jgi:excinuclease ABC subunit C